MHVLSENIKKKQANSENLCPPPYLFSYTIISDNNVYPNHMHLLHVTVSNINLRIIFKPHANLQIMVRTSVQFEKNQNKTEGGVCTQGTQCPFTFIV